MNQETRDKLLRETHWREIPITREAINEQDRTVEMSFAAGANVARWWGIEHLNMQPKCVRLARWKDNAAFLMNHDPSDQRGVILNGRLDADAVLRGTVKLSRNQSGEELLKDMLDGIRTKTSIGYEIHNVRELKPEEMTEEQKQLALEYGCSVYDVNDWEPFEGSSVYAGADPKVGLGRNLDVDKPLSPITQQRGKTMPEETTTPQSIIIREAAKPPTQDEINARKAQNKTEIEAVAERFKGRVKNMSELAKDAIDLDITVDEFNLRVYNNLHDGKPMNSDSEIGMSEREKQSYSFNKLIDALSNPNDAKKQEAAAFELECSRETLKKEQRTLKSVQMPGVKGGIGAAIPVEMLRSRANPAHVPIETIRALISGRRDLLVGTGSIGGNLVATDFMASSFIDVLRNRTTVIELGAQLMPGMVGNIAIPKRLTGASFTFVAEGSAVSESTPTFGLTTGVPRTLGGFVDISRKMLIQSTPEAEALTRDDMIQGMRRAVDSAAISANGTAPNPTGIIYVSGIGATTGGAQGAAPTWANITELEREVAIDNADLGALAYLTNAKVRHALKNTVKSTSAAHGFIWEGNSDPLNGYRVGVTNQVPSNLTKGTTTGESAIIFGNFNDLLIPMWSGLDILVDPYTASTTGTVRVVCMQDLDIMVRHAESFAAMLDAVA